MHHSFNRYDPFNRYRPVLRTGGSSVAYAKKTIPTPETAQASRNATTDTTTHTTQQTQSHEETVPPKL